jgi:hypothetical protein
MPANIRAAHVVTNQTRLRVVITQLQEAVELEAN